MSHPQTGNETSPKYPTLHGKARPKKSYRLKFVPETVRDVIVSRRVMKKMKEISCEGFVLWLEAYEYDTSFAG